MNIDDLSHNSFEEQWQNAFEDASMLPPDAVWEKIELGLDNRIPPKPGNNSYYFGAISALIFSIVLWYFVGNKEGTKPSPIIENKPVVEKKEEVLPKTDDVKTIKSDEKIIVKKAIIPKEEVIIESQMVEGQAENVERIITDSVDFITPISPKPIKLDFTTITPEIQIEQTPYYEKPKPKPKEKSIFKNVRISGGIGVHQ